MKRFFSVIILLSPWLTVAHAHAVIGFHQSVVNDADGRRPMDMAVWYHAGGGGKPCWLATMRPLSV